MTNPLRLRRPVLAALLALLCTTVGTAAEPLPGFKLDGTKWTYNDGQLSMEGILIKPNGEGPFPAILISHGRGGNAGGFGALAAYGNSMGAFITIALSAREASRLTAAAITAGGISRGGASADSLGRAARVPLCILHGSSDTTVPPESSVRLKEILDRHTAPNERHIFDGVGHNLHQQKADEVYRLIKAWFIKYGVLKE